MSALHSDGDVDPRTLRLLGVVGGTCAAGWLTAAVSIVRRRRPWSLRIMQLSCSLLGTAIVGYMAAYIAAFW